MTDLARHGLSFLFVLLLFLIVLLAYRSAQQDGWDAVKEWLDVVFPATTALLGSAVGFYFGERRKN